MNRTIKFRVWNRQSESMVNPEQLEGLMGSMKQDDGVDILMQFTGLLDKNGKEIYEGAICQYKTGEKKGGAYTDETIFKGFVRFDGGQFEIGNHNGYGGEWVGLSYLLGSYHGAAHDFEVIGNIYENKELLK